MQTSSGTLERFHQFVGQQLTSEAAAQMTPEQAVALWREQEENIEAIREGLADADAGRTRPAEEVLRDLQAKLSAP